MSQRPPADRRRTLRPPSVCLICPHNYRLIYPLPCVKSASKVWTSKWMCSAKVRSYTRLTTTTWSPDSSQPLFHTYDATSGTLRCLYFLLAAPTLNEGRALLPLAFLPSFLPTVRSLVRSPVVRVRPSVLVAFGDELLHEPVGCIRRERKPRGRRRRRRRRRRSGLLGIVGMLPKTCAVRPHLQVTLKQMGVSRNRRHKSSEAIAHLAPLSGREGREQREEKWRESHRCSPR